VRIRSGGYLRSAVLGQRTTLVAVPLLVFVALAAVVIDDPEPALDHRLLAFLHGHTEGTALAGAAELLVWACLWLGLGMLLALMGTLSVTRRYSSAVFMASTIIGALVLEKALKHAFKRAAIDQGESYSFPSGSAMISLALVAAFVFISGRRRRAWAFAGGVTLVFVYGLSIVSLGWHYPSDVAAGWSFGLALVSALWLCLGRPTLDRASA
jgi:membrane-associated phospholipid phosphatase